MWRAFFSGGSAVALPGGTEYVITHPNAHPHRRVAQMLKTVKGVSVLDELDEQTALVRMSEQASQAVQEKFPELFVEPNIPYRYKRAIP